MNVLASLILGHLIADFPLQTTRVFLWKMKSLKGVAFHAGIHLLVNVILFAPSLTKVWPALLILFGIHTFQDHFKVKYGGENVNTPTPFILDQLFHFLVLFIAVQLPPFNQSPATLISAPPGYFIAGLIAATFMGTILVYVLARNLPNERKDLGINLQRQESDFLFNGLLYSAVFTGAYPLALLSLALKALLWKRQIGGGYYSLPIELGISPLWAAANAILIRFVLRI